MEHAEDNTINKSAEDKTINYAALQPRQPRKPITSEIATLNNFSRKYHGLNRMLYISSYFYNFTNPKMENIF